MLSLEESCAQDEVDACLDSQLVALNPSTLERHAQDVQPLACGVQQEMCLLSSASALAFMGHACTAQPRPAVLQRYAFTMRRMCLELSALQAVTCKAYVP